jgi:hypothetical protein
MAASTPLAMIRPDLDGLDRSTKRCPDRIAVLADADTQGRVLVLDKLGNSLGKVNRKDVLGALRAVADRQKITS